ncbi:MAG: xylulokinase [Acetobacteraceae bacterium]|nr:xylulokinase [Acetobacteraceae bacterium]
MHLGLDLGTSGVKAVLTDDVGAIAAQATAPLTVSRPRPGWSEQDPASWWDALVQSVEALRESHDLSGVRGIGLSGQQHGAVLLDARDHVLRPAILWNDGRSAAECAPLDPLARQIAGNLAMPGFTAPKLLWVRGHEPEVFRATSRVLLPKDWLRLCLVGDAVSEPSDASGTLWLDVAARRWSPALLEATGLDERHMPRLVEGDAVSGRLRAEAAAELGLPPGIPVAGGAGDNAAGAAGIGCVRPGQGFVSLGTSGVVFVCDAGPKPAPERAVHAFCHCLPQTWHRMSVILSAAGSLAWFAGVSGVPEAELLAEMEREKEGVGDVTFLPYLSGERTPHNDAQARGAFLGLDAGTTRAALTRAVLEGVAFALADGLDALSPGGLPDEALWVIGGGGRSAAWLRILAAATGRVLLPVAGAEAGPALGAARLARAACGDAPADAYPVPPAQPQVEPEPGLVERLAPRRAAFRRLYPLLRPEFAARSAVTA